MIGRIELQPPFGLTVLMDTSVTLTHVYATLTLTDAEREELTKRNHWITPPSAKSNTTPAK